MSVALRRAAAAMIAFSIIPCCAEAQSLSDRRAAKDKAADTEIEVACGRIDKENCAVVVPLINERTVSQHVRLKPLQSKGSVESVRGLCDGDVNIAIVQADVFALESDTPNCAGKLSVVGSGLYPYMGFAIVRADRDDKKFGALVDHLKAGETLSVAAGGAGSGGEATLRTILSKNETWKQSVSIEPDGVAVGLNKVRDRQLDVIFVMDGPQSPLIKTVRETIDQETRRPAFDFVDLRPNAALLEMKLNGDAPLYATAVVAPGLFSSTKTIATPAVIAVRNDYYNSNPDTVGKIRQAAEDALPAIASKSGARPDWAADFTPR